MVVKLDHPDPAIALSCQGESALRIVAIGGGTGLSTLLHGLKDYARAGSVPEVDITAVVTVSDDGGSSGRLRREFDVLPPGDIRNCMVALSEDAALLSRLFQYRFASGRGLKGHSFGNLFLTALTHVTGDFAAAVKLSAEVLAIAGRIYPSTTANVSLEAVLEDGTRVQGETRISKSQARIRRVLLKPRRHKPMPETLEAIARADLITFGPGSLFTSVIPNLLVDGIPEAIERSKAAKVYYVNLMWQPGETMEFKASDHVNAIYRHTGMSLLDYVITNTTRVRPALKKRYAKTAAQPVENDWDELDRLGLKVIAKDLIRQSEKVRHDSRAIADLAVQLALKSRAQAGMARLSQAAK